MKPDCKKGYKFNKKKGICEKEKKKSKKNKKQGFFIKWIDFLFLIPLTYGFLATQINRFAFNKFGRPLPSIWFHLFDGILAYPLAILTLVGFIWMFIRIFKRKEWRYWRIIILSLGIIWFSFVWYLVASFSIK